MKLSNELYVTVKVTCCIKSELQKIQLILNVKLCFKEYKSNIYAQNFSYRILCSIEYDSDKVTDFFLNKYNKNEYYNSRLNIDNNNNDDLESSDYDNDFIYSNDSMIV